MKEKNSELDNFKPRKITISSTIFPNKRFSYGNTPKTVQYEDGV